MAGVGGKGRGSDVLWGHHHHDIHIDGRAGLPAHVNCNRILSPAPEPISAVDFETPLCDKAADVQRFPFQDVLLCVQDDKRPAGSLLSINPLNMDFSAPEMRYC